jgi:small subunit ribosomal protein S9
MNKDAEKIIDRPLIVVGLEGKYYFTAKVSGGGITGQIESIRLGLARALYDMDEELKTTLRKEGLVTRDPRMVERKKYHHVKARKKPQFSKR